LDGGLTFPAGRVQRLRKFQLANWDIIFIAIPDCRRIKEKRTKVRTSNDALEAFPAVDVHYVTRQGIYRDMFTKDNSGSKPSTYLLPTPADSIRSSVLRRLSSAYP
jgi:hypothetical protein